ncbi:AI-2E family transporter [Vibrio coralliirubri]|uniref:AI-2E family transporter n=1 Tax=Vibrio coralliirubri TaxID=1516159 RepID=UPI002283F33A|nr:AI-2E family transporter [Vibrio coralliirubri]MCY9861044.1 AI-2E family transporter [Vibrio coralliirubri]
MTNRSIKESHPMVIMAAFVVIIAGLKTSSSMLTPILLAIFISLLCNPLVNKLEKHKVPRAIGSLITVVLLFYSFYIIGDLAASTSKTFVQDIQISIEQFALKASELTGANKDMIKSQIDALNVGSVLSSGVAVLTTIKNSISFTFIVALTVFIALCEGNAWGRKIATFTGTENVAGGASKKIQTYIAVKAGASVATGLLISIALYATTDHKYWILWGILATALNFIPNIGSFLAAIPPLLVAATMGIAPTVITLSIFMTVNIVIGSYLEPKKIGEKLGLSTLVVFFSMIFFGWMFDIVGMLLSVPIMVFIKIALDELEPNNKFSALLK